MMRRTALFLSLVLLVACRAERQTEAQEQLSTPGIQQEQDVPALTGPGKGIRVEFPTSTGTAAGYLSQPSTITGKHPGLIVIQEWWGLDDWIKENTDRFAGEGYISVAVDLYRGRVTEDPEEAHELMRGLPQDRAMSDLKGAFDYLAARPDVDPGRIGVIGWCMGGGYSISIATVEPRLKATVINYGHLITDPNAIRNIQSAILGNFGGKDRGIPEADVRTFQQALTRAGKRFDIKIYPNAGHGFMNPKNKDTYDLEATEDAWKRIFTFLKKELEPPGPAARP
jgi:carboxymethylenebutenolidase